jgi:virulence-associated protein VapD
VHDFLRNALNEKVDVKRLQSLEFEKEYFEKLEDSFNSSSYFKFREDAFMIKEVLTRRMKNILYYERQRTYENIYACEKKYASNIKTVTGQTYRLECKIDRIDTFGKDFMIFDYKTGNVPDNIVSNRHFKLILNDYNRRAIKKAISSLQLPLYKYIFENETGSVVLECGFYDLKKNRIVKFPAEKEVYEKCIDIVRATLDEIISGENFEVDDEDKINCKTCPYFYICR